MLPPVKKNADKNEHNTQAPFLSLKTYKLEASGLNFIILSFFVRPGRSSKGPFNESSNNLA